MRKVGYLRRLAQQTSETTQQQVQRLKEHGCEKVIVIDHAIASQIDFSFDQISKHFELGDTLVTIRLSRLCPTFQHLIAFCQWLKANNINLLTLEEDICTNGNSPNFHEIVKAIVDFKSEIQKEQTLLGLSKARAIGRIGGRPKGLSEKAQGKAEIAAQLYRNNKMTTTEICEHLSIARMTLYNYLRSQGVKIWKDE